MKKNITKTLIIFTAVFLLNSLFAVKANAACTSVPASGPYTIDENCSFANTYDGVDSGTGTTNTAVLTVNVNKTLTLNEGQTIGFGSIILNGTITIAKTGTGSRLLKAPIWAQATDADSDGYPSGAVSSYVTQQANPGAGWVRRNVVGGTVDCNDNDNTKYQNLTGYNDVDGDTYTSGTTSICSGASLLTYNISTFPYRAAANGTDCLDTGTGADYVYQALSVSKDADADGYGVAALASTCVGALSGGYRGIDGLYNYYTSRTGYNDCLDNDATSFPGNSTWYATNADHNCNGTTTALANSAVLAYNASCAVGAAGASYPYYLNSGSCPTGLTSTCSTYKAGVGTATCSGFVWKNTVSSSGCAAYTCNNTSGAIRYN